MNEDKTFLINIYDDYILDLYDYSFEGFTKDLKRELRIFSTEERHNVLRLYRYSGSELVNFFNMEWYTGEQLNKLEIVAYTNFEEYLFNKLTGVEFGNILYQNIDNNAVVKLRNISNFWNGFLWCNLHYDSMNNIWCTLKCEELMFKNITFCFEIPDFYYLKCKKVVFEDCSFASVVLAQYIFSDCNNLEEVKFINCTVYGNNLLPFTIKDTFIACQNLKLIDLSGLTLDKTLFGHVCIADEGLYKDCPLVEVRFSDSIQKFLKGLEL